MIREVDLQIFAARLRAQNLKATRFRNEISFLRRKADQELTWFPLR